MRTTLKKGDMVQFREVVDEGDEDLLFVVTEVRGDRALFTCINVGFAIPPTYVYPVEDMTLCAS